MIGGSLTPFRALLRAASYRQWAAIMEAAAAGGIDRDGYIAAQYYALAGAVFLRIRNGYSR